jgi:hypothetical protein
MGDKRVFNVSDSSMLQGGIISPNNLVKTRDEVLSLLVCILILSICSFELSAPNFMLAISIM